MALHIGLTGGIGCGKSTVAKMFDVLQIAVFNSDAVAKKIVYETQIKESIIKLLGPLSFVNNMYNSKYVASIVFNNKEQLLALNNIIHPAVNESFEIFASQHSHAPYIIKESAILFENSLHAQLSKSILVVAPLILRINRIKIRDNASEDEITKRIQNQWTDEQKIPFANYVIVNNELESVIKQVLAIDLQLKNILSI